MMKLLFTILFVLCLAVQAHAALQVGSRVYGVGNTDTFTVHSTANGSVAGTNSAANRGNIIGGPTSAGGFTWWQVNWDAETDGWVKESDIVEYVTAAHAVPGTWTTPLPSLGVTNVLNQSSSWVGGLPANFGVSGLNFGFHRGIWYARSDTPMTTVLCGAGSSYCQNSAALANNIVPIPNEVYPPGYDILNTEPCISNPGLAECYSDSIITIISADRTTAWDLYQARRMADGTWRAGGLRKWNLTLDSPDNSPRIIGDSTHIGIESFLIGSIRYEDVRAGLVPHALSLTSNMGRPGGWWNFHPLESWEPLGGLAPPPVGTWQAQYGFTYRLPPSFDPNTLSVPGNATATASCRTLATALRDYGARFTDDNNDNGTMSIMPEDMSQTPLEGVWQNMLDGVGPCLTTVRNQLQVVEVVPSISFSVAKSTFMSRQYFSSARFTGPDTVTIGYTNNLAQYALTGFSTYYTLDGSEPTTSSTLYTGPFVVNASATIKAKSFKTGSLSSGISRLHFLAVGDRIVTVVDTPVYPTPFHMTGGGRSGGAKQARGSLGTIVTGPDLNVCCGWWQVNFDTGQDGWIETPYFEKLQVGGDVTPPSNVTSVNVSDPGTSGNLNLTWANPGSDFAGVLILRRAGSAVTDAPTTGQTYNNGTVIGSSTVVQTTAGQSFNDSGLVNGTTYHYKIFAFDSPRNYASGATGSGTPTAPAPDTTPPANITSLSITNPGTAGELNLSWTNPTSDFTGTIVLRRASAAVTDAPAQGQTYQVGNTIGSSTVVRASATAAFQDTGLTDGVTYHYKVFAHDLARNYASGVAGSGTPTDDTPAPDTTPPADVTSYNVTDPTTGNKLDHGWTNPVDADFNAVLFLRGLAACTGVPTAGQSHPIGTAIGNCTVVRTSSGTSFSDTSGLVNGVTYHYKAFSYDNVFNYAAGVADSATPTGAAPATPTLRGIGVCTDMNAVCNPVSGFGSFSRGGSPNNLCEVSNTDDTGAGSFRDCVGTQNREVRFVVGGEIALASVVEVASNVSIRADTAPSPVTLTGHGLVFNGSSNSRIIGLRIRNLATDNEYGIELKNGARRIYALNLSITGLLPSVQGAIALTGGTNQGLTTGLFSCEWCLLDGTGRGPVVIVQDAAGTGAERISINRSLIMRSGNILYIAPGQIRTEQPTNLTLDFRNNVVFNANVGTKNRAGLILRCGAQANVIKNYFYSQITDSQSEAENILMVEDSTCPTLETNAYVSGNIVGDEIAFPGIQATVNAKGTEVSALPAARVNEYGTACHAAYNVLAAAGALPRDEIDQGIINTVSLPGC